MHTQPSMLITLAASLMAGVLCAAEPEPLQVASADQTLVAASAPPAGSSMVPTIITPETLKAPLEPGTPASIVLAPEGEGVRIQRFLGGMGLWGVIRDISEPMPMTSEPPEMMAPESGSENLRQISYTRVGADFGADIDPVSGLFVVYASTQHRKTADLYLKQVDGFTVTQLTTDSGNDVMPSISPDGELVAFASDRAGNWDSWVKRLDGGRPIQVTIAPSHEMHPSWSPDGRYLAFCSLGEKSGQWEIVVVEAARPSQRRFVGYGLFPRFSPDGKKLLFQRTRQRGTRTFSIWTMDYKDGEGIRPTEIVAASNAALINPAWSPDSKRIVFSAVLNPSADPDAAPDSADIWAVNVDGSNRSQLTSDRFANLQPVWGPNGMIYFISNRTGWDNLWALRPGEALGSPEPKDMPGKGQ